MRINLRPFAEVGLVLAAIFLLVMPLIDHAGASPQSSAQHMAGNGNDLVSLNAGNDTRGFTPARHILRPRIKPCPSSTQVGAPFLTQVSVLVSSLRQQTPPLAIDPIYGWHTFYGGTIYDDGYGIVLDAVATSTYRDAPSWPGPAPRGSSVHAHSGGAQYYGSQTQQQWRVPVAHLFGTGADTSKSIAIDDSGDIYVTGSAKTFGRGRTRPNRWMAIAAASLC